MNEQDWEFIFELMLSRPSQPQECRTLLEMLRRNPWDRSQRAVVADWFYEYGHERTSELIRKGYTPGGQRGHDLTQPPAPRTSSGTFGPIVSGSIGSGQVSALHVMSSSFPWTTIASGSISLPAFRTPPGSAYEDLDQ